jgi:chaperonin GroEL (HSP60 family)
MQYMKPKSAAKISLSRGPKLQEKVLATMREISSMVGSTLGPGGCPVLIEDPREGMPVIITKDGVTVHQHLGFQGSIEQSVLEAARSAAVRTAEQAGDGPQPLWSNVLTPNGFIKMADIRIGMDVCGTDGSIQRVIGIYPKGEKEIVKVSFEDGSVVECCEDHLWSVTTSYGSEKTLMTKEIAKDLKKLQPDGSFKYKYFIPKTHVDFCNESTLPLDPYLVGVLLGDGSLCDSGSVELFFGKNKEHIIEKIRLPNGLRLDTIWVDSKNSFRVKITGETVESFSIRDFLSDIGLRNKDSYSKFIPKTYLMASKSDRIRLLQGLIDTDGHINDRGQFEFSTVNSQLAIDFKFLCKSLGKSMYMRLHERKDGDGSYGSKSIYRFNELKGNTYGDKIISVEYTGKTTAMQCIKVSNEDHLYITNDFIPTHNTTTATILSEAIVARTVAFSKEHPTFSPQKGVRFLQEYFTSTMEPSIREWATKIDFGTEEGKSMARSVATISANGDTALADSVIKAFELVGDSGNVTITEADGDPRYEVDHIKGYIVFSGYEQSCKNLQSMFINDRAKGRIFIKNPTVVIYNGVLNNEQLIVPILQRVLARANQKDSTVSGNVVVVAHGFSDAAVAMMGANCQKGNTLNCYPIVTPRTNRTDGQVSLIEDLAALTDAVILDPLNHPLTNPKLEFEDLGYGLEYIEVFKDKCSFVGHANDEVLLKRVDELKELVKSPDSKLDKILYEERIAKLVGGIAKLTIYGSSPADIRERKDRADDAVCAIRGAIKDGCLPGGAWTLIRLGYEISKLTDDSVRTQFLKEVLADALAEPFHVLLENIGLSVEEVEQAGAGIVRAFQDNKWKTTFDGIGLHHVDAFKEGILDSVPAVMEAVRNSISIASHLGILGGIIVFPRDRELEMAEAKNNQAFQRAIEEGDLMAAMSQDYNNPDMQE